jgi:hypothetical protein
MSPEQMKGMKRKVKEFYETQNEILVRRHFIRWYWS